MSVLKKLKDQNEEFTKWRRHIHANPETAFEEEQTADYVTDLLKSWGVEYSRGLAKTAVVAVIEGKTNNSKKSIGLRADMDALNMIEKTNLPHASKNPGKMHACGHDGHTTTLLAAVKHLAETRDFDGTVYAIFQPAEEGGAGADVMIKEGFFDKHPCDAVFGFHNWPWLPAGKMAICEGAVTASTDSFEFTLTGKGGHAAMPQHATDIIVCASQIVSNLQHLVSRTVDPMDSAVISVTKFHAGDGALNVLPQSGVFGGTVRTVNPATRKRLEEKVKEIIKSTTQTFGITADITWHIGYPSTINTPEETDFARNIAKSLVGEENVEEFTPTMGGEDFAYFLQKKPGCYMVIGGGKTDNDPGLHDPHYDYNDEILPVGAAYFVNLAENFLK